MVMELLLFHVEIAALAGVIVGLYALRGRLGLTPVYLAAGVLMGFMVIGARIRVPAPVFGEASARYVSMGYLPLLMATIALIYTLEGTRQARRFLGGLVLTKVFVNVLKALIGASSTAASTWRSMGESGGSGLGSAPPWSPPSPSSAPASPWSSSIRRASTSRVACG